MIYFSQGFSYYFALILKSRFEEGLLFYESFQNIFLFYIDEELYDVNGKCTEKYKYSKYLYKWDPENPNDDLDYQTIIRECIKKNDVTRL
jgi:hypothetical protein